VPKLIGDRWAEPIRRPVNHVDGSGISLVAKVLSRHSHCQVGEAVAIEIPRRQRRAEAIRLFGAGRWLRGQVLLAANRGWDHAPLLMPNLAAGAEGINADCFRPVEHIHRARVHGQHPIAVNKILTRHSNGEVHHAVPIEVGRNIAGGNRSRGGANTPCHRSH
jgi:hypothetical protein